VSAAAPTGDDVSNITAVQVRYATGIDRRDWVAFRSCFTNDCEVDYGDIGRWRSGDEITDWMRMAHEPAGPTLHRMSNHVVGPVDGDRAIARCYVDGVIMAPDRRSGTRAVGWYDDELVRTGDGWRIARRSFTPVMLQMIPDGALL
jgi:3-phenylpropionate/cinnamic acid dioxygenase small subunit